MQGYTDTDAMQKIRDEFIERTGGGIGAINGYRLCCPKTLKHLFNQL
jgi:hypothetical protein